MIREFLLGSDPELLLTDSQEFAEGEGTELKTEEKEVAETQDVAVQSDVEVTLAKLTEDFQAMSTKFDEMASRMEEESVKHSQQIEQMEQEHAKAVQELKEEHQKDLEKAAVVSEQDVAKAAAALISDRGAEPISTDTAFTTRSEFNQSELMKMSSQEITALINSTPNSELFGE